MNNKEDILRIIGEDRWMMDILKAAKSLQLPDWWICAGFVRSKVWDSLHGFQNRTALPDVDVIYFNKVDLNEAIEKKYEAQLQSLLPCIPWSVKNQARMHIGNEVSPYLSSIDAISKFPETATAVGVRLDKFNDLELIAPLEIDDLINLKIRPTPFFMESENRLSIYHSRLKNKNWKQIWNGLSEA